MPKASRVGKFRQAAKAASPAAASTAAAAAVAPSPAGDADKGGAGEALSRGQKKRLAKREQYLRRERLVMGSLQLKKQQEQAKRIDGLDAIKEALLATTTTQQDDDDKDKKQEKAAHHPPNLLKSQKSRQTLLQRESNQLQLVMQHPAFQDDPLATIQRHLTNSLAPQAAQREREQVQRERQVREEAETAPKKKPKRKRHRARPTRSRA